ncbi:MAG TPA: Hsp20/alpha crystallin family protein [Verrucomicrobiae bacterium]|nr:Hsp20/alpha crystallin family protein [Verrucomicrobiae bacterium]
MNLTRWQRPDLATWAGFGRLSDLRDEIDRLFESPLSEFTRASQLLSGWTPALDMHEDKDNVVIVMELPGMKKEDIDISLHNGSLTISGERKNEEKYGDAEVYRAERFVGKFQRSVTLPAPVSADKVTAQYKEGVLTITLPKSEEAKPKQIEVQVS